MDKSPAVLIIGGRYVPGMRFVVNATMGLSDIAYRRFLGWSVISGILWSTYTSILAYEIGLALGDFPLASFVISGLVTTVAITVVFFTVRRNRRRLAAAEPPEPPSPEVGERADVGDHLRCHHAPGPGLGGGLEPPGQGQHHRVPLVFTVAGYLLANPDWGRPRRRRRRAVGAPPGGGHARAPALLGRGPGRCGEAAEGHRRPGTPARDRSAPHAGAGRDRGGVVLPRPLAGTGLLRRGDAGAHRRRPQRPGGQRRADPDAPAPRAQRRERSQRRHRDPDRGLHPGGGRDPAGRHRGRPLARGRRPAGAGGRHRRRSRGRAWQRPAHLAGVATSLDRPRRPATRVARRGAQQLRPRRGAARQRLHRGLRGRDRVRGTAEEGPDDEVERGRGAAGARRGAPRVLRVVPVRRSTGADRRRPPRRRRPSSTPC